MPTAVYRSWIGAAKMSGGFAYLTAPVAALGTSLSISNTSIPASSTVFFIDGPNSESVAVSAGGGTQTLTVGATVNAHAANTPIYAQVTGSLGPTDYIPSDASNIDFSDDYVQLPDKAVRGSNVDQYGSGQGTARGLWKFGGPVMADTVGWGLGSIFGAVDFAGGSPNSHTFAANNTAATNGQPTGLLIYDYDGVNTRCWSNAKADEFAIKFDVAQNLSYTVKGVSNGSIVVANPTLSFSTLTAQAAWQCSATIAGSLLAQVTAADFTWSRTVDAVQTLDGTQAPYQVFSGALMCKGNLSFIIENDTQILQYLNNSQPTVVLSFTNGTGATQVGLTLTITKANFESGTKINQTGATFIEVNAPIVGLSNTTDANTAGGGYSPGRVKILNSVATGHYQ